MIGAALSWEVDTIIKRCSLLLIIIALSLLGLVVGCAPSYTEGDLDIARQVGYSEGYDDGYAEGHLIGKSEGLKSELPSESTQEQSIEPADTITPTSSDFVYITRTGAKYHRGSCRYLSQSSIKIERVEAISNRYTPCLVCRP